VRALREAEQRVADFERRLAQVAVPISPGAHSPPAIALPMVSAVSPAAASTPAVPAASLVPVIQRAPSAAAIDVAALARDVHLDRGEISAFDGSRRRRRMIVLFGFFLLVVFGGLFAMLAESYSRHPQ
jgi:hypothetical protein